MPLMTLIMAPPLSIVERHSALPCPEVLDPERQIHPGPDARRVRLAHPGSDVDDDVEKKERDFLAFEIKLPEIETGFPVPDEEKSFEIEVHLRLDEGRKALAAEVDDGLSLDPVLAEQLELQFFQDIFLLFLDPEGDIGVALSLGEIRPAEGQLPRGQTLGLDTV
jgi:hypothetical protein